MEKRKVEKAEVCGIGLAVPGGHKSEEGICLYSPNFAEPFPAPILEPIEKATGLAAYMLNDVNTAALGEHRFGAGRGYDYMVMITLGTGIGGGAVIDGELRIGPTEGFAEVGHMIVDPEGPECGCGNHGCWEALAARDAIIERAVFELQQGEPSLLVDLSKGDIGNITPSLITEAAEKGDELALEVLEETAYWIGIGCVNLITLYNPQVLVIGGGIAGALPIMEPVIQQVVDTRSRMVPAGTCKIVPSALGDDAGIIGGAVLVLRRLKAPPGGRA
jgi:glucokinase